MFPQENQPGNLVNVLQLDCWRRQTLLLGGQIQFVYTQAARDSDRQPHTGRLETGNRHPVQAAATGVCGGPASRSYHSRGGPAPDRDTLGPLCREIFKNR